MHIAGGNAHKWKCRVARQFINDGKYLFCLCCCWCCRSKLRRTHHSRRIFSLNGQFVRYNKNSYHFSNAQHYRNNNNNNNRIDYVRHENDSNEKARPRRRLFRPAIIPFILHTHTHTAFTENTIQCALFPWYCSIVGEKENIKENVE